MVGRLPYAARAGRLGLARAGDRLALVGPFLPSLAASELAKLRGQALPDSLTEIDLALVREAQAAVCEAVRAGEIANAHDIAEGGLAVALAECCLAGGLGAEVRVDGEPWATLFGEGSGGFVVSGAEDALRALGERTTLVPLGTAGGERLAISCAAPGGGAAVEIELSLTELRAAHGALAEVFS